jgi:hypothetical protein
MFTFFGTGASAVSAVPVVWPKSKLVAALKKRYRALDDLGEEHGLSLYGASEGDVKFVIALIPANGKPDAIAEVGFLARFVRANLNDSQIDIVNRNLHISIITYHSDGDLYLIGGIAASGDFNEGAFSLVLEAWKRDLTVALYGISHASSSLVDLAPAAGVERARRYAANRVPETDGGAAELFRSLAGASRSLTVCGACDGRGKLGFMAHPCSPCGGSGFVSGDR